jgi:hypothetical protein
MVWHREYVGTPMVVDRSRYTYVGKLHWCSISDLCCEQLLLSAAVFKQGKEKSSSAIRSRFSDAVISKNESEKDACYIIKSLVRMLYSPITYPDYKIPFKKNIKMYNMFLI